MAAIYYSQGRYDKAEELYVRALALWKKLLGEEHPDVATSLHYLAVLYHSLGRYKEAEPLFIQALEIREQRLGANHPDTVRCRQNLEYLRAALNSDN